MEIRLGLLSEGKTDNRFLPNLILKTFEKAASERDLTIIINPLEILQKTIGVSF
jgi:hypothetical protein